MTGCKKREQPDLSLAHPSIKEIEEEEKEKARRRCIEKSQNTRKPCRIPRSNESH
jgi:hypothetical protein